MAHFTINYFSDSLNRPVDFEMMIPNDKSDGRDKAKEKMRTLFLLHGYRCGAWNWVPEHLAEKYNFAVVVPKGENAFWLDGISTGHSYGTFIGEELPGYIRSTFGLANSAEDTYIMGFSMGGFGALHTALKYPEQFGKAAALSPALIVHTVAAMTPGFEDGFANFEYYRECFGAPEKVLESDNNPEVLIKRLLEKGEKIPEIMICCGLSDFLIENVREFHGFLERENVPHEYFESAGGHDFDFWGDYTVKFTEKMFE